MLDGPWRDTRLPIVSLLLTRTLLLAHRVSTAVRAGFEYLTGPGQIIASRVCSQPTGICGDRSACHKNLCHFEEVRAKLRVRLKGRDAVGGVADAPKKKGLDAISQSIKPRFPLRGAVLPDFSALG